MTVAPPLSSPAATIGYCVRAAAARTPLKAALSDFDGRSLSYRDLILNIERVARVAHDGLGLAAGQRTAIMSSNSIAFVELCLGLAEARVPAAMIGPQSTPAEIEHICNDADVAALFVQKDLADVAHAAKPDRRPRIVTIEDDLARAMASARPGPLPVQPIESDVFCIPYTSGTTGKAKGVLLSHRARVLMALFAQAGSYGVHNPDCRALAMSPFFTGGGFANVLAPLLLGGSCHIFPRFMAEAMLQAVADHRITNTFMVPTHFHALFNLERRILDAADTSSLRVLHANAAPLPQPTKEKIVAYFGPGKLYDSYGSTEYGSATCLRPAEQLTKISCVGLPHPGAMVKVLRSDGTEATVGDVGEVFVQTPWMFDGYLNRPDATAEAFRDGWCTVGDLGRKDDEGYLYLVDRKKNVIITGGQNVFPREIEDVLHRHTSVRDVAVVGLPDPYWGEAVTAYLELQDGASITAEELKTFCTRSLAPYKIPKAFHVRPSLPRNAGGKILHRALRAEAAGSN